MSMCVCAYCREWLTYEVPIYELMYISGRLGKDEHVYVHIVENG